MLLVLCMVLNPASVSALTEGTAEPDDPAETLHEHSCEAAKTVAPTCEGVRVGTE